MDLNTIFLGILVWHFVGKDWFKKEDEAFRRKEEEYRSQREARYRQYEEEEKNKHKP